MALDFAKEVMEEDLEIKVRNLQEQIDLQSKQILLLKERDDYFLKILNCDRELNKLSGNLWRINNG